MDFYSDREIALDAFERTVEIFAEVKDVAALGHRDRQGDGVLAHVANLLCRRIDITAIDVGNIAESEQAAAGLDADFADALHGVEAPGNAQIHPVRAGVDRARRRHGILSAQDLEYGQWIDTERRQFPVGNLDVDLLFLVADDLGLGDVRNPKNLLAHLLDIVLQFRVGVAVSGERVEVAEDVAEFVVEERPDCATRKRVAHVADFFAHLVPHIRNNLRCGRILQGNENSGLAGLGVRAHVVQERRLLKFLFKALGDLLLHFPR